MLDRRWRHGVERGLGPFGRGLRRLGVPADALTVFGLLRLGRDRRADRLRPFRVGGRGRDRRRRERPARRRDRARQRPGEPTGRVLRLRHRPGLRRAAARRRRLVPRRHLASRTTRCSPWPCWRCSMLVSYERARAEVARPRRPRRAHGARRALRVPRASALAFDILVPVLWIMLVLTAGDRGVPLRRRVPPGRATRRRVHARAASAPAPSPRDARGSSPAGSAPNVVDGAADRRRPARAAVTRRCAATLVPEPCRTYAGRSPLSRTAPGPPPRSSCPRRWPRRIAACHRPRLGAAAARAAAHGRAPPAPGRTMPRRARASPRTSRASSTRTVATGSRCSACPAEVRAGNRAEHFTIEGFEHIEAGARARATA